MATSIVETITPQKAQEYLSKSGGNRNISKPVVNSYATTMAEGKWLLNGEPIVFDIDGVLINGHHRLYAIIKANIPIKTFVVRGVEHDSYATFDCGRHRSLGQLIGMQGIKHYNSVASVVNCVYRIERGIAFHDGGMNVNQKKTNSAMIEYFNSDRDNFVEAGDFGAKMRNGCPFVDGSVIGASYYYLINRCGYEKDFVCGFFSELCSYDTSSNPMINNLRKRMIAEKVATIKKTGRQVLFALLVKVWNAYASGIVLKNIKYSPDTEEYPKFLKCSEL